MSGKGAVKQPVTPERGSKKAVVVSSARRSSLPKSRALFNDGRDVLVGLAAPSSMAWTGRWG